MIVVLLGVSHHSHNQLHEVDFASDRGYDILFGTDDTEQLDLPVSSQ
jgi:hypothetical protein